MSTLKRHVNSPRAYDLEMPGRGTLQSKMYVGFVKSVEDASFMGRLQVWIPELSGDPTDSNGWFLMNYCSPFAGATNYLDNTNGTDYLSSQRSYGMWFVPPDINNEVVCAFINGDPARGIWLGCLFQQFMNNMVPGIAGSDATSTLPVGEYNKNLTQLNYNNPIQPGYTPLSTALNVEGLNNDIIRGTTDSSARRSNPSNSVNGILTPGGTQIVFDDNPSNTFIRLRTQTGCQLLIHDTVGCIYLNTPDGRNWISMDANGRVDIYSAEDISIRAQGTLNLRADKDVNIEAGQNINMKARGDTSKVAIPAPINAVPLPSTAPGPIEIIGDVIAAGISSKVSGAASASNPSGTSSSVITAITGDINLQKTTNAVVALGTNDDVSTSQGRALLSSNLSAIKSAISATNWVWILPYNPIAKGIVQSVASGGTTIDLSNYPTTDGKTPRSYEVLANDIQQKCVQAASSTPTTIPTTSPSTNTTNTSVTSGIVDAPGNPIGQQTGNIAAPAGTTTAAAAAAATGAATGQDYRVVAANFLIPYEGHASGGFGSYPDPNQPSNPALVTTGYGHVITQAEYGQGFVSCGTSGNVPCSKNGNFSQVCPTMTQTQALGLLSTDVPKYSSIVISTIGQGSWDLLGPYQQAALTSVAFNSPVGLKRVVAAGLTTFIASKNIESAAELLDNRVSTNNSAGLTARKKAEGNLYRQKPNLAGQGGPVVTDGLSLPGDSNSTTGGSSSSGPNTIPGTGTATPATGGLVIEDPDLQFGYIRMESRNSMHLLSDQHMFISSVLDTHRYAGQNMYDTAAQNNNRLTGGFLHESVNQDYGLAVANNIIIISPRVDINGPQPPPAIAAVQAVGPTDSLQTDAVLDTVGNLVTLMSETIVTHLLYHEPYPNHGGRVIPSVNNVTTLNSTLFTTLRDGEVIPNTTTPLNVFGTPLSGMPQGVYTGVNYNVQNQPVYNLSSDLSNIALGPPSTYQVSPPGLQFIESYTNGSFMVEAVGDPPVQTIGYGHDLTPDEITSQTIVINGTGVDIHPTLTQSNITDLLSQDITTVQNWVIPLLGNVSITQTQFDMLCSLAFSTGQIGFTSSPVLSSLIAGNYQKIPNNWMQHTVSSNGTMLPALIARRQAESIQFMTSPLATAIQSRSGNIGIPNTDGTVNVVPSPAN